MTSTTENPPAPDADPRGGERGRLAAEFQALAEKATQGEVEADPDDRSGMEWNWHVVQGDDRMCFMSNGPRSEDNAAFIAWCFNHRADIKAALRPQPNARVLTDSAQDVRAIRESGIDYAHVKVAEQRCEPGTTWDMALVAAMNAIKPGSAVFDLSLYETKKAATPIARAQAAAEEIADLLESNEMRGEVGRDINIDVGPKTRERLAAIITKHLGAGAGVTLTEEEHGNYVNIKYGMKRGLRLKDPKRTVNDLLEIIARFDPAGGAGAGLTSEDIAAIKTLCNSNPWWSSRRAELIYPDMTAEIEKVRQIINRLDTSHRLAPGGGE